MKIPNLLVLNFFFFWNPLPLHPPPPLLLLPLHPLTVPVRYRLSISFTLPRMASFEQLLSKALFCNGIALSSWDANLII